MISSNTLLPFPSYLTFRRYIILEGGMNVFGMIPHGTILHGSCKGKGGKEKRIPSPSSVFTHLSPASDALS